MAFHGPRGGSSGRGGRGDSRGGAGARGRGRGRGGFRGGRGRPVFDSARLAQKEAYVYHSFFIGFLES